MLSPAAVSTLENSPPRGWSPYQLAVFDAVEDENGGNLVIAALAGSGKTTTLVEAVGRTEGRCLVVAFNAAVVETLKARCPGDVDVRTLNSLGHGAVLAAFPGRPFKADYMRAIVADCVGPGSVNRGARKAVERIVSAAKNTLTDWRTPCELTALAQRLGIEFPPTHDASELLDIVENIMAELTNDEREGYRGGAPFNFDDQLWLPHILDLEMPQYDWVFVDEAQDLNLAQIRLLKKCLAPNGRAVFVGDRHQAIYGFRGADPQAIGRITAEFSARTLPLSICYRCPLSVIAAAQELVLEIEAAPDAANGNVIVSSIGSLCDFAKPGDLVLSRSNAPLVSLAFRWIRFGKKVYVRGRDIGQGLVDWIENRAAKHSNIGALQRELEQWHKRELQKLEAADAPTENCDDTYACLKLFLGKATTPEGAARAIVEMFADTGGGREAIVCSSVHRAKGTEAPRVWLLIDTFCRESAMARNAQEEKNLLYVAITRSQDQLYYVDYYEK